MSRPNLDAEAAAELVELDRDECLSLLATCEVGRVVFTAAAMPAALPVRYLLDGEEIVFRTGDAHTFAAIRRTVVGFQTDDIDRTSRTGWTVLGVGRSYEVTDPRRTAALAARLPAGRAAPLGTHLVAVPMQHLTGHRLPDGG